MYLPVERESFFNFPCFSFLSSLSFQSRSNRRCAMIVAAPLLYILLFTGDALANHILKRRHLPHHRSQCRPRLTSSTEVLEPVATTSFSPISTSTLVHPSSSSSSSAFTPIYGPHSSSTVQTTASPTFVYSTSTPDPVTLSSSAAASATTESPTTFSDSTSMSVIATSSSEIAIPLSTSLTPNNIKAGIAGGDAYPFMKDHIGWWYDWYVLYPGVSTSDTLNPFHIRLTIRLVCVGPPILPNQAIQLPSRCSGEQAPSISKTHNVWLRLRTWPQCPRTC